MASIIPGYEYDIFISYRQKDNKHDGWVTEFVDNLKGELESTFKEEISVYFDINPHDGLLETHDVNASLKEKLRCLIFIPIISQTYCDPQSFAWQHEFCAFNKLAKEDQFGRDIRLVGGNVASRILPVKIHDLDSEDKTLLENELGGVLRSINFIYKASGVNRPLKPKDERAENLNHTYYSDQINKVANAVKEIITALKKKPPYDGEIPKEVVKSKSEKPKNLTPKIVIASFVVLALIVLGYIFIPKLFKPSEPVEKSIAILPFKLLSNEPDKQYLADGMMEAILLNLSKIKDLTVMSSTSVEQFRITTKTARQIGKDLGVEYLLEGSFQKDGNNVRLTVKLIKTRDEINEWADKYDRNWNDVFSVQSEVAQTIASELKAKFTPEEKQLIEKIPTTNLTAYDFYQRGRDEYTKYSIDNNNIAALQKAEELYHKALKYDSTFAQAYTGLALIYLRKHWYNEYFSQNFLDSVLIFANTALSYDDKLAEAYFVRGSYYDQKGLTKQAMEEFDKTLRFNPNNWTAYYGKGNLYSDYDHLKSIENLQKAASLNHGSELPDILFSLGKSYLNAGFIEKAKDYAGEVFKLVGDTIRYLGSLETIEYCQSNYEKALEYLREGYSKDSTDVRILSDLAYCYSFTGQFKESVKYYKKYIDREEALGQFDLQATQRIGYAYWKNGDKKEAEYYFDKQMEYCKNSIQNSRPYALSKYAYYDLAGVYAFRGNKEKAYENLRIFNQRQRISFVILIIMNSDPLFESIRKEPEFQQITRDVEAKYRAEHERVSKWMVENHML